MYSEESANLDFDEAEHQPPHLSAAEEELPKAAVVNTVGLPLSAVGNAVVSEFAVDSPSVESSASDCTTGGSAGGVDTPEFVNTPEGSATSDELDHIHELNHFEKKVGIPREMRLEN